MGAIAPVGRRPAVDGYDELLGPRRRLPLATTQRNEIATSLLRENGLRAATMSAADAGVPALSRTGTQMVAIGGRIL